MKLVHLTVFLALICAIFGDIIATELPDQLATTLNENTRQMIRMEKEAKSTTDHYLYGDKFKPYPQLAMEFELPFSQFVDIYYHISVSVAANTWFVTRLHIDGKEDPDFRTIQSGYEYTNMASSSIYLSKGTHHVKVQYKTNGVRTILVDNWDFATAYLKVRYYKPGELIPNTNIPKKVTKKVTAPADYSLMNNNKWQQLSGLILTIKLDYAQQVEINERIVTATNPQCFLATRIKIDGEVNDNFDKISWNNDLHEIQVFGRKVWLEKGAHFLQLQYKTKGNRDAQMGKEFQVAFMEIVYHEKK